MQRWERARGSFLIGWLYFWGFWGCWWWHRPGGEDITVDKAQLEALVLEIIRENPQVVFQTLNSYLKEQRQAKADQELEASFLKRVPEPIPEHAPWKGAAEAPITIVEYTDFECRFCAQGAGILNQLLAKYPNQLKIVFRHNPLEMHPEARPAAKAAIAAHQQGKFWAYHDLLFKNMQRLSDETYLKLAEELQLDLVQFNRDRASAAIEEQVAADQQRALMHRFTGTPMFIVNGVVVQGAKPLSYFAKVIDRLLSEKSPSS